MGTPKETVWEIEPHTQAKHEILRRYLGAWFPILGTYNERIIYIDGFCGPGRYKEGDVGSPIIALREAVKHEKRLQRNKLLFLFSDERPDRIDQLNAELKQEIIPSNFEVRAVTGEFEERFRNFLDAIDKGLQIGPTFAFVDPFGFKGIPFELMCKLLQTPRTEVFINIMIDSINRFLEHPDKATKQHIVDLFGTPNALEIARNNINRIEALRLLYQEQLSKCANFVRYFEMRNLHNRPIYYLFFATNHRLGHLKMKEAFWKVDSSSGFRFSDATNPNQLVLFELDESLKLAKDIQQRFSHQKQLVKHIREFVEDETSFLSAHMRKALKHLEDVGGIHVETYKQDGKKRRKNTFPNETIVTFLK